MSVQQLQKLMIINKTKQLGWWIRLKSLFITLLTWGIWLVMAFMIWQYRNSLLDSPVIDIYYIGEVILFIFAVVFTLIFLTVCWSYLAKSRHKKTLRRHTNRSNRKAVEFAKNLVNSTACLLLVMTDYITNYAFAFSAALTITANAGAFNDAPPTNAPSISG